MITVDTNIFIDFFCGHNSSAVRYLIQSLENASIVVNPFVLSELLSSPKQKPIHEQSLTTLVQMNLQEGFFLRGGLLRLKIYSRGHGITISDVYLAQLCIDEGIPILSDDEDMKLIEKYSDLKLVKT